MQQDTSHGDAGIPDRRMNPPELAETMTRVLRLSEAMVLSGNHLKSSGTLKDRKSLPISEPQLYQKFIGA